MNQSRIVTPQEARKRLDDGWASATLQEREALLGTVATEPDRTRAAVVEAVEAEAQRFENGHALDEPWGQRAANALWLRAIQIKNGADYA